jgi:hypothetical protein
MLNEYYQKLREKYKPIRIKYLLIAESPPQSEDGRFFYNPNQEKWDFLFKSVMEVVFPDFTDNYQKGQKAQYLQKFKEHGFYLIDAVDIPINHLKPADKAKIIEENSESKIREITELISKDTPIVIIQKKIFEIFYPKLKKRNFNVVHGTPIPPPYWGWQQKFKEKFRQSLKKISSQ